MSHNDRRGPGGVPLPLFVGGFLALVFLLVGVAGSAFTVPRILRWLDAADWIAVEGEIVSGEVIRQNATRGGATVRPHFVWRYRFEGREHRGEGFGLTDVTTDDFDGVSRTIAACPPGSRVEVLVDPQHPEQSILERDPPGHLLIMFLPPLFGVFGVLATLLTLVAYRRRAAGRLAGDARRIEALAQRTLLRPAVLKAIVVGTFGLVMLGLALLTATSGDPTGLVIAAVVGYGLWRAMRGRRPGRA